MDFDVELSAGEQYESVPMPYSEIWLLPQAFACAVCRLSLTNPAEAHRSRYLDRPNGRSARRPR